MVLMPDRVIMTRLVKGRAPGREFDIEFWQKLGPSCIFEAAWDLVVTAAAVRGIHEDQLRLQRSVTKFERGQRPVVDFGGESAPVLCWHDVEEAKRALDRPRDRRDLKKLSRRKK